MPTHYRRVVRCPVCKKQIDTWEGPDKEPSGIGAAMCLGPSRAQHGNESPQCRMHEDWVQGWIYDDPVEVEAPEAQPPKDCVGQEVIADADDFGLLRELDELSDRFRGYACPLTQRVRMETALAAIKECLSTRDAPPLVNTPQYADRLADALEETAINLKLSAGYHIDSKIALVREWREVSKGIVR
jgi:hypothetical protein